MKYLAIFLLITISQLTNSATWFDVSSENLGAIQIAKGSNSHGQTEGLYLGIKAGGISGEAATYCTRKDFLVVTDPELVELTYSGLLFALATNRTIRFYLNGANSCVEDGPLATMVILNP